MFDLAALARALGADARRFDAEFRPVCASTNAVLLERAAAGAPTGTTLVAGTQTAGRGRQGRTWLSSPGDSLTFSLLWRFASGAAPIGLPLAVGVAVARALDKFGIRDTALKWPNDVLKGGRKLAGILVELVPGTPHAAVIGIGLNQRLPADIPDELRARSAALDADIEPHVLLAALLIELRIVLEQFADGGFAVFRDDWLARNAHADLPIRLLSDFAPPRGGICRGVAADGALLLETGDGNTGRIERVLAGEVSLRGAE
jgi:BirA family biotin operon repressor/biotin-[acetyl-CoA-carboxylase] ligase